MRGSGVLTIENLTGQDRILLWDITGQHPANERADAVAKALRLIGKLTEALAAAGHRATRATASADEEYVVRKAAERDRDAARALLRQWRGLYAGRLLPEVLARQTDAHLSGQPAAPACACGHPEESGKHGASMCEIDEDDQREPAPTPHEAHSCDWFGRFTCRICGKHRDEPAAPARDEGQDFELQAGGLGLSPEDVRRLYPQAAPNAADARVRELEAHNASLRERNTELVHMRQVAEARVRELESRIERQRVANRGMHRSLDERDAELAALRERVQSWERVALSDDTTREAVHLCLHDKETELNQLRGRVAKALAALESPAWPPLARIQDTLEALRG